MYSGWLFLIRGTAKLNSGRYKQYAHGGHHKTLGKNSLIQRLIYGFMLYNVMSSWTIATLSAGLPACTLAPLQHLLNAAAHLMVGATSGNKSVTLCSHYTGCRLSIEFVSNCMPSTTVSVWPSPWTNNTHIIPFWSPQAPFCYHNQFAIPRTRSKFDDRPFSVGTCKLRTVQLDALWSAMSI